LLFTGDAIDAAECWRIGLANPIVPHEKLIAETYELARKLLEGPPEAMAVTKELLDRETAMDLN
jgi:enoyl-CoA hydratase/carnithine racemase